MPNVRRRIVACSCDWVAAQFVRRDSSGWADERGVWEGSEGCCWRRRVSGRPGAEGAPRETEEEDVDDVNFEVWVFVVLVAWVEGGAMRRDWPD